MSTVSPSFNKNYNGMDDTTQIAPASISQV